MAEMYSGTHGHFYDQDGKELTEAVEFELTEEFEKAQSKRMGKLRRSSRITASDVTMSVTFERTSSVQRLIRYLAENPEAKVNFMGQMDDPVAGKYGIAVKGFSPDSLTLAKWAHGEIDEDTPLEGTVDDYEFM